MPRPTLQTRTKKPVSQILKQFFMADFLSQVEVLAWHKVRLGMENYGGSLMVLKMPRQILIAIYDLLKGGCYLLTIIHFRSFVRPVTRCLYRNCQVLHRDISDSNALIAAISADISESIESKTEGIHNSARLNCCSADHLLYPDG